MPETTTDVQGAETAAFRDSTCIHTRKIYDSCQSKDCVEHLRFYPAVSAQTAINNALSLKAGRAELLYVYLNVQPIGLGRGFYTIDMRFYYRVTIDTSVSCTSTTPVVGLAVFDKRCVLFGSEGTVRSFSSTLACESLEGGIVPSYSNLPVAICEAVDPLILSMKLVEPGKQPGYPDAPLTDVPEAILEAFGEELDLCGSPAARRIFVTLGQFSILRLERDSQLQIPVYDYCMPRKECECDSREDDPCELFQQVDFPVGEFFPPASTYDANPADRLKNGFYQV